VRRNTHATIRRATPEPEAGGPLRASATIKSTMGMLTIANAALAAVPGFGPQSRAY